MRAGFRPGTDLRLTDPISSKFGLDPTKPDVTIDPADLDPAVLQKIMNSWGVVKKPAVVTFVVDTSGSMEGTKLEQAKEGLIKVLDNMEDNNQVGLVTFSGTVNDGLQPRPLREAKFDIAEVVTNMTASRRNRVYDVVRRGIDMSDQASVSNDAKRDTRSRRSQRRTGDGRWDRTRQPHLDERVPNRSKRRLQGLAR